MKKLLILFLVMLSVKSSFAEIPSLENIENFEFKKIYKESRLLTTRKTNYSNVVIVNDIVYYVNPKGELVALKLNELSNKKQSERIIYKKEILDVKEHNVNQNIQIAYSEGNIYINSGTHKLYCAKATNGQLLWQKSLYSPLKYIVVNKEHIYATTANNKIYAIHKNTGAIIWNHSGIKTDTVISQNIKPILYKDKVMVTYSGGDYYSLSQKNGSKLFSDNLTKYNKNNSYFLEINSSPIINNDVLYISGNGILKAINLKNYKTKWLSDTAVKNDMVIRDGYLYSLTKGSELIKINSNTGYIEQSTKLNQNIYRIEIINDILLLIQENNIVIVDLQNFNIIPKTIKFRERHKNEIYFYEDDFYNINSSGRVLQIDKLTQE